MEFIPLPIHLILLVHLYILEYPHANNSEYDHDLFNPRTRGLRERAKAMEDITYFLVGKIEGKSAKIVLPTYPCGQPSESLAFRTSLAKYLEGLRHLSLFPSSTRAGGKPTAKSSESIPHAGWWWKDIVVRKSLLEECSGEKFQRLILALSTHAVMKCSSPVPADKMSDLIESRPAVYVDKLAQYQAKRHNWTKSASLLLKRKYDLKTLREALEIPTPAKHDALSTERLLAFEKFKRDTLLQENWSGKDGTKALDFLATLAGIQSSPVEKALSAPVTTDDALDSKTTIIPSPLPIAAAHHPSHIKRLRRPIFNIQTIPGAHKPAAPARSHAEIILAEQLDCEKRTRQMLLDALSKTAKAQLQMMSAYEKLRSIHSATSPKLNVFWTPPIRLTKSIDFNPASDRKLLDSLGCDKECAAVDLEDDTEDALEKNILHIRQFVLPPYLTAPDPLAQRIQAEILNAESSFNHQISTSKIPSAKATVAAGAVRKHSVVATTTQCRVSEIQPAGIVAPSALLMSPGKSSRSIRRKSVRFSMAQRRTGRPSIFRVFSNGKLEDEVDRLIDETNDFPTDDEDSDTEQDKDGSLFGQNGSPALKTPKALKAKPIVNRIWTAGTPKSAAKQGKLRVSSSSLGRLLAVEPAIGLPSASSMNFEDQDKDIEEDPDEMSASKDPYATPKPPKTILPRSTSPNFYVPNGRQGKETLVDNHDDDEEGDDGPPSMTLKEILLAADGSHLDLLEFDSQEIDGGMMEEDSFVWE